MAKITKIEVDGKGFGPRGDAEITFYMPIDGYHDRIANIARDAAQEEWRTLKPETPSFLNVAYEGVYSTGIAVCRYKPRYANTEEPSLKFADPRQIVDLILQWGEMLEKWFKITAPLVNILGDLEKETYGCWTRVDWDSTKNVFKCTIEMSDYHIPKAENPQNYTGHYEHKFTLTPEQVENWRRSDAADIYQTMKEKCLDVGKANIAGAKVRRIVEDSKIPNLEFANWSDPKNPRKFNIKFAGYVDGVWTVKNKDFPYTTGTEAMEIAATITLETVFALAKEWGVMPKPKQRYVPTSTEEIQEIAEEKAIKKKANNTKKQLEIQWAELQGQLKALTQTP